MSEQNEHGITHFAGIPIDEYQVIHEELVRDLRDALTKSLTQGLSELPNFRDIVSDDARARVLRACRNLVSKIAPDVAIKVIADEPTEEQRLGRIVPMHLEMPRSTWNDIFVPMGYEPVPETETVYTIDVTVEK